MIGLVFIGGEGAAHDRSHAENLEHSLIHERAFNLFGLGISTHSPTCHGEAAGVIAGDVFERLIARAPIEEVGIRDIHRGYALLGGGLVELDEQSVASMNVSYANF